MAIEDVVMQAIIGLVVGAIFGLYGYVTKAEEDEEWSWRKFTRTAVIYGAAGFVVGWQGGAITEPNVVEATAFTAVLGEVVDKLWSRIRRRAS